MNAEQTKAIILPLLTIDHVDLATPIRLVRNTVNITSRGNVYTAVDFNMNLPDDTGDKLPTMRLTLDNVDRRFTADLRSISTPATITYEAVLAETPNVVEVGPFTYSLRGIDIDANTIVGQCCFEDLLNTVIPNEVVNPKDFPGVFN